MPAQHPAAPSPTLASPLHRLDRCPRCGALAVEGSEMDDGFLQLYRICLDDGCGWRMAVGPSAPAEQ